MTTDRSHSPPTTDMVASLLAEWRAELVAIHGRAVSECPPVAALCRTGARLVALGLRIGDTDDIDAGMECFDRALREAPYMASGWAEMRAAYASVGKPEDATVH